MRPPSGIDLSSNDYLGLAGDSRLRDAFVAGIQRDGVGSTGSRLLRGHRDAFARVEDAFARFKGTERSLFFSSGYLANLAVLTALTDVGDLICSDARNHASLIDATRLARAGVAVNPHNDLAAVTRALAAVAPGALGFVVVESLYSMDGDDSPLRPLADLCAARGGVLVVDEAHAVGVRGARGTGALEEAGIDANTCISINTGGKALGVGGAFVAGPAVAIEALVQRARPFIFSTASPPAMADALLEALRIVAEEPERRATLRARSRYLRRALRGAGLDVADTESHIVPIVLGDNERAVATASALQRSGFDVRAIRPPTVPVGTARLRLSLNMGLDESTLDRFVAALSVAMRQRPATVDA